MPEIEKKEHDLEPGKEEDIVVKAGNFRVYFQNYYTIISLGNDLFTGVLYLSGSLVQTFTDLEIVGMYLYIFASFFLLMRPVLKIMHSVFIYREEEYRTKILGEDTEESVKRSKGQTDKPTKEFEIKSNEKAEKDEDNENKEQVSVNKKEEKREAGKKKLTEEPEEIEQDYNENYYGEEKNE